MANVRDELREMGFFGGVIDAGRRDGVLFETVNSPATKERLEAAGKRWRQIRDKDLVRRGRRYWVDKGSGALYVESLGDPLMADDRGSTDLFAVISDRLVFLTRSEGPASVAELDEGERAEEARQAAEERDRRRVLERRPQVQVWFGQAAGRPPVELRDVVRGFERSGGRIGLDDAGQLTVTVPERLTFDAFSASMEGELRRDLAGQAEAIVHCRVLVEAALRSRNGAKTPLADQLPAGCVTVTGGVA